MRLIKKIFFNQYFFIVFVFFLTFFLRFFNLPKFISYHQDQVRDLLYVKQHFDNHQIILLGPKASVGNFYLPPFWYYLMSIAYFFSHSPLAPAFMVVILNSLAVVFIYIFAKKFFGQKTAIFSSLLYSVSPISIEYSRFAWNPNPIPFFTILTLYFLFFYLFEINNLLYFALGVIFANLSLQLHYQGFIIFSFYFLAVLLFKKIDLKRVFFYILLNLILLLPFLIYEFQNNFANTSGIINFVLKNQQNPLKFFGIPFFIKFLIYDFSLFLAKIIAFKNIFFGYLIFGLLMFFIGKSLFSKNKKIKLLNYFLMFCFLMFFVYKNSLINFYLLFFIPGFIIYFVNSLYHFFSFRLVNFFLLLLIILNIIKSPTFGSYDNTYLWLNKSVKEVVKNKNYCVFYDIFPQTFIEDKLNYLFSIEKNQPEKNCFEILQGKKPKNIKTFYYFCEPAKCQPKKFKIDNYRQVIFKDLKYDVKIYKYYLD